MARPVKQGLDYYPRDIDADLDDKLSMIIGEYAYRGELLFDKLCGWIYKHEGYYVVWEEATQLKFLRRYDYCGFSVSFINEVVPKFIKWGLFDKAVFDAFNILTSRRIQKTWLDATTKRKDRKYLPDIWLLEVIDDLKAEETRLIPEETTQSKVKEKKVKETKVNGATALVVAGATPETVKRSDYEKLIQEISGKEKKEIVTALREFLSKRPQFLEPYADYWNLSVQGSQIPEIRGTSDSRVKKLKTRLGEAAFDFVEIISKIYKSRKLKYESSWFSFDWVFENDKNYLKILEGNYD